MQNRTTSLKLIATVTYNQRLEQLVMNALQLDQVLMKDPFTKGSFAGVYACDQLSSIEINEYPKSFVVNTDPMEFPGTHWITIYFNEQMKGEFLTLTESI